MAEEISFIHAADLHLDSPFKGLANLPEHVLTDVRESTFAALDRLVHVAIERQVDFVLIAGDLFDNEHQTLKAQIRLRNAFTALAKQNISVYMLYGNHDHINGNKHPVTYPVNVHIFPDEIVRNFVHYKDGKPLAAIYGFSYEDRSVLDNKTSNYKRRESDIPFHIGMLHGSLASNTTHDVYAPFQISELLETGMDYWALGHIHQRDVLKSAPAIVYSGNTQGRSRKETGDKGCYHVKMSAAGVELSFLPLQAVTFKKVAVDASTCEDVFALEQHLQQTLKTAQSQTNALFHIQLTSDTTNLEQWDQEGRIEELIDLMNEAGGFATPWQYIYDYEISSLPSYDELYEGAHFSGEVLRQLDTLSIPPQLTDLYHHRRARRFLEPLDSDAESDIKEKAKQWLMHELLGGRT
ncbi:metallophosphoesterase family protein [Lentibacillus saliphilus]|uniref:metallophosphoesterase family protein n=1 Tax=Lentibacillus saliphilus TaxID=2737028 RepID=UPI001C2F55BC